MSKAAANPQNTPALPDAALDASGRDTAEGAVPSDWYRNFFGSSYRKAVRSYATPGRTAREVEFLLEQWQVPRGAQVLDACCGDGRHAVALAKRGFQVTGLDFSASALRALRKRARKADVEVETLQQDVLAFHAEQPYSAACCLFNSFGYFASEQDNAAMLSRLAEALQPGARLILQLPNRERVFQDASVPSWEESSGGVLVLTEHWVDLERGRLEGIEHRVLADGRRVSRPRSIRVYSLVELTALAEQAGLERGSVWGGPFGSSYELDSPEMLVVLRRPD